MERPAVNTANMAPTAKTEKLSNASNSVPYTFEHSRNLGNKILKPIRQEKVVRVPVTQYVEKIIEKEEIKFVNKYVDVIKPIITYKTKHISKPIYLDKIKYEPKLIEKEKIIHIPKIEYRNKIVEIPVYLHKENIIEKKVPLIIERVLPVLKVKKVEKEVLTDVVDIPSICEMEKMDKMERKINSSTKHEYKETLMIPQIATGNSDRNNFYAVKEATESQDMYNKETYRNVESRNDISSSPAVYSPVKMSPSVQVQKFKGHRGRSDSVASGESDENSRGEKLEHKNETMYNDATQEEDEEGDNYGDAVENAGGMLNEEYIASGQGLRNDESISREHVQGIVQTGHYSENDLYKKSNLTHVSIHLPRTKEELHEVLQGNSVNAGQGSYGSNRIASSGASNLRSGNERYASNNNLFTYDQRNNRYNEYDMNQMMNDQLIRESFNGSRRDMSKSVEENVGRGSYYSDVKNRIESQKHNLSVPSNMNVYKENYSSTQNVCRNESGRTRSNFMPSYANSNGQAIVSVRPATILEYVPKQRKAKGRFCSFMNRCCGDE
ncbi:Uncharacterized protein PCOAH_00010640 [Plasmodium coatneyi]|uniref:Inner membrane complex protein 1i n=1 Tax=Plasmodium coatneyi TaxID=208452 RepID=A0A1B1DVL3_9APIC|nr:Uncharacterized protein PCOAH_00010640 [Plasmodium coatneyi]ANQ06810.1 Uncharacterized protein PCOAH_00010640 [Plasmodium coatneyi]